MFKKIASNTIAQILSKAGTAMISIFLLSVLTKYLPVEYFGMYSKIYNYLGIFAFLADLGLYAIVVREISHKTDNTQKIIRNVLSLRLILGIMIVFLALGIAYFLPGYNSKIEMIGITIVGIFTVFSLLNSALLSLMQAKMQMEFSSLSTISGKLVNLIGILVIVFVCLQSGSIDSFGFPLTMIFFAGLAGIIVNTAMNYRYARRIVPLGLEFDFSYMWSIVRHALPYGVALFLSVVYFKVDVILLSLMESQELADRSIALYSLPMKIIEVLMVIGGFYLNSLLPSMTSLYEEKRTQELENILVTSFKVLLSFGILFFVVGVLLREEVIRIIATPEYLSPNLVYTSADAFLVVLGAIVFYFLSLLSIYIFITVKKHTIILWINIIITLVNILGNIWLIPKFSFMGAGVVTLFSQILLFVMTYLFSRKYISFAIPGVFTLGAVVISTWIYVIGFWLLTYMSVTPLFDVVVYGGVLFGIGAYAQYQLIRRGK